MPVSPDLHRVQKNTSQPNTGRIKNSTIQPARLTNPTNSNKSPMINSERSSQDGNIINDGWITQKSKRNLSSSSSDTSPLKAVPL